MIDDYNMKAAREPRYAGNARNITDEVVSRYGDAGPAYVNQDRGARIQQRNSLGSVNDALIELHVAIDETEERVENIRIILGASLLPVPETSSSGSPQPPSDNLIDAVNDGACAAARRINRLNALLTEIHQRLV